MASLNQDDTTNSDTTVLYSDEEGKYPITWDKNTASITGTLAIVGRAVRAHAEAQRPEPAERPRLEPDRGARDRRGLRARHGRATEHRGLAQALALAHRLLRGLAQRDYRLGRLVRHRREHLAAPALHSAPASRDGSRGLRSASYCAEAAASPTQTEPQLAWVARLFPQPLPQHEGRLRLEYLNVKIRS